MGADFQENLAVSNDCDAASFRNLVFTIDDIDLTAFSQCGKQVSLINDNFLSRDNESFGFNLGR